MWQRPLAAKTLQVCREILPTLWLWTSSLRNCETRHSHHLHQWICDNWNSRFGKLSQALTGLCQRSDQKTGSEGAMQRWAWGGRRTTLAGEVELLAERNWQILGGPWTHLRCGGVIRTVSQEWNTQQGVVPGEVGKCPGRRLTRSGQKSER